MDVTKPYLLANCTVIPKENTLCFADQKKVLQPKFIELLSLLVARYPETVSRDEIIKLVWQDNYYVGEKALTNAVWHIRRALKDADPDLEYIETIRKTGYRLLVAPSQLSSSVSNEQSPLSSVSFFSHWFAYVVSACALIALFIASFLSLQPHANIATTKQQVETLTMRAGRALFPTVSFDDHYMVYSWRGVQGNSDLYIKDLLSLNKPSKPLTDSTYSEGRAVFSQDGNRLFYYRFSKDDQCQLVQMHLVTGEVDKLADCDINRSAGLDVHGNTLAYLSNVAGSDRVHLLDISHLGAESRLLPCRQSCDYDDESVVFSPSGKQVAVSRNLPSGYEELFIIELDSGAVQQITHGFVDIRGLDWHPQKEEVIFSVIEHGQRQGYKVELSSNSLKKFMHDGFSYPFYSQAGDVYFHQWNIDSSLMRLDLSREINSMPYPIISGQHTARFASYNPVVDKLVYISNKSGFTELWLTDLQGAHVEQLTELQQTLYHPSWSEQGRYIAFVGMQGEVNKLYIFDLQTRQLKNLATGLSYHSKPSWGRDDKSLLVSDGDYLYRFDLNGKNLGKVVSQKTAYGIELKTGDVIFSDKLDQRLWQKSATDGSETVLVENIPLANPTAWSYQAATGVKGAGIYFFNVNGADYRISYFDLEKAQQQDIIQFPERAFSKSSGLQFIAKKNWLVYTAYQSPNINIKRSLAD